MALLAPLLKEAAIAEDDVLRRLDAQAGGGAIDPLRRAFELGVVADGSLIDHAVAFAVGPLGAPFFITEGGNQAERQKDLSQSLAVGDLGLGLDPMLVRVFARPHIGQALVGDGPSAGIAANAQNLGAGAHRAIWRVVEDIALECARSLQAEAGSFEALGQSSHVVHAKFDLSLDGHRKERVYGSGQNSGCRGDNRDVKTLRLIVNPAHLETPEAQEALERAAAILRGGGLVALPTETVYGLGANALNADAVARIFAAKQRPSWDPIIVHIANEASLAGPDGRSGIVRELPESGRKLMAACWPGPLTLLLPRTAAVPDAVTAGRPLVGVRMPAHPVALELILRAGVPVAAPSANLFGHTSPTSAEHVLADLDGRIDAVLDAGPTDYGVESTVLDPCQSPMMIYRPGAVTIDQIRAIAGPVEIYRDVRAIEAKPPEALPSPGVGLRHYAPSARLVLVEGELIELAARLVLSMRGLEGERVGVMLPAEVAVPSGVAAVFPWGHWAAPEEMAHTLYAGLRELDGKGCTAILCPLPPAKGIGTAIRDRLTKAGESKSAS